MELGDLRRHWDRFGRTDPLWAILTAPDKRHGAWNRRDFFYSGQVEIARVFDKLHGMLGARVGSCARALDFGCGVGRATQALCAYFDRVDGVDISTVMIEQAINYNRFGERCTYHLNQEPHLRICDDATYDFVYTAHVLQHMQPKYARGYVQEFFRIVRAGGLVVFEITTERIAGASTPLPDSGFRAAVEGPGSIGRLRPGEMRSLSVKVTNLSNASWPSLPSPSGWCHVTLGNHWHRRGQNVAQDDGRVALPYDLAPGDTVACDLVITAPLKPGQYELEIDLVQEGVAWFADRGSHSIRVPITVRRSPAEYLLNSVRGQRPPAKGSNEDEPVMEMHGTPESEIHEWISSSGGCFLGSFDCDEISGEPSKDWRRVFFVATQ